MQPFSLAIGRVIALVPPKSKKKMPSVELRGYICIWGGFTTIVFHLARVTV